MTKPGAGGYRPVLPLDVLILRGLPKEGAIFQGVFPEGDTVAAIVKRINKPMVTSPMVSTRVRVLRQFGYATRVTVPRQNTAGWQVTPLGEELVRAHPIEEVDSGNS